MTIDLSDIQFDALLKRLHLANTRRAWRDLVQRAERDEWSYRDFLALLVSEEIAHRQQTRIARMVRRAHFPFFKTIDDFTFTYQSTVRLSLLGSALAADFVTDGRCLIFGGKPGRGKTHLAVAIAYRAIQHGFDALFVTAAELIDDLSGAFRRGQLADALARYVHPAVIVIDEVGYLTYGTDAANMLFHVVNDRHRKKRAMIFTTNKPLTAWGRVLHDEDLAHAIVDRILERGRMLTLDGPSMRTQHLGLDDATSPEASAPPARISGIQRPEFPEPTSSVGYIIRKKPVKAITDAETGERIIKGNLDTEIVLDMLNTVYNYDVAFLLSGDSDFERAVDLLRSRGKRVYIVTSKRSLSRELAYVADKPIFLLEDLKATLARDTRSASATS